MLYCPHCKKECCNCVRPPEKEGYTGESDRGALGHILNRVSPISLLCIFVALLFAMCLIFLTRSLPQKNAEDPSQNRYLSVYVETDQEVNADYVEWRISFQNTGVDIAALQTKMSQDRTQILNFLREHGFTDQEILVGGAKITDQFAREWGQADVQKLPENARYVLDATITVFTSNVQAVIAANREQDILMKKSGIIFSKEPNWDIYPKYTVRNRIVIERDLYQQAIQKAHAIALQMAQGMNARIKNVRNTQQDAPVTIQSLVPLNEWGGGDNLKEPVKRASLKMIVNYNIE